MIARLSPRGRRALALGLLALLVVLAVLVVTAPVLVIEGYRTRLAAVEQHIATLQRGVPARQRLAGEAKTLQGAAERLLLRGTSPGVAAHAQLRGRPHRFGLGDRGRRSRTCRSWIPAYAAPYTDVGLRLTMTAGTSARSGTSCTRSRCAIR